MAFSITTKGEFTKSNIDLALSDSRYKSSATSMAPVGVRTIAIQEERFASEDRPRLRPSLKIGDDIIDPSLNKENVFYSTVEWTIYYSQYKTLGTPVVYSVV